MDEAMKQMRNEIQQIDDKHETNTGNLQRSVAENFNAASTWNEERREHCRSLDVLCARHQEVHAELHSKVDTNSNAIDTRVSKLEADLLKQDEDLHKEINDRVDGVERHHANV